MLNSSIEADISDEACFAASQGKVIPGSQSPVRYGYSSQGEFLGSFVPATPENERERYIINEFM